MSRYIFALIYSWIPHVQLYSLGHISSSSPSFDSFHFNICKILSMDHLNGDLTVVFKLPKDSLGARGPCGAQLETEGIKDGGRQVKNAIGVFLLSLLELATIFNFSRIITIVSSRWRQTKFMTVNDPPPFLILTGLFLVLKIFLLEKVVYMVLTRAVGVFLPLS